MNATKRERETRNRESRSKDRRRRTFTLGRVSTGGDDTRQTNKRARTTTSASLGVLREFAHPADEFVHSQGRRTAFKSGSVFHYLPPEAHALEPASRRHLDAFVPDLGQCPRGSRLDYVATQRNGELSFKPNGWVSRRRAAQGSRQHSTHHDQLCKTP